MAITDIRQYVHLTAVDIEELGRELDAIRTDIEESRGERDARYVRRTIQLQRGLVVGGRIALLASRNKVAWVAGTALLGIAKIIENLELGHNIMHGQWDWLNDPEIHSTEWEWDTTSPSVQWKHSHNFVHHKYTNIVGIDDDVGYGLLRVTRDQRWKPEYLGNPVFNLLLGTLFEWGVALHGVELTKVRRGEKSMDEVRKDLRVIGKKVAKQVGKDYIIFPALSGRGWKHTLAANAIANLIRNYWAYLVIFCGHFPDGAEKFTREEYENETHPEWYLRQMLGSARPPDGLHERQPVLPDRAPPVPRPAKQPVRRNMRARQGAMRQVRPAVHDWILNAPVYADVLDNPQALGPEQVPPRNLGRRARNPLGAEIPNPSGRSRELRCRTRHRQTSRAADRFARASDR